MPSDAYTRAFLEQYGTDGAGIMVRRIVEDWLALEVNADLVKAGDPMVKTAQEIIDRMLPALRGLLDEQANK